MPNYTVRRGDTLGAIARRLGVPVSSITGYRSGNPNRIYTGEVLTYGGSTPGGSPGAPPPDPEAGLRAQLEREYRPAIEGEIGRARRRFAEEETGFNEERNAQEAVARRLRDSIARNFQRQKGESSLDLQRRGLAGAGEAIEANNYLGTEEARATGEVDTDLANKLSAIASRLGTKRQGLAADISEIERTGQAKIEGGISSRARDVLGQAGGLADILQKLLDSDIDRASYERIARLLSRGGF